jgi:tetratricopeptide (TPR) repeat protein
MLLIKFAKRLAMILVVTAAPLMMPRVFAQENEEFKNWQREPKYTHSIAAQWTMMADRYLDRGDVDRALPLYEKALYLDEKFAPAYHNRAQCYIALSRNAEALADLNRCLALGGPEQYMALCSIAHLQYNLGHYPASIAAWNKVLGNNNHSMLLEQRAETYEAMGKYDLAIADLTDCLKIARLKRIILAHRARVYTRMHQYDKVIADCSGVIKEDPDGSKGKDGNVAVLKLRAEAYRRTGKAALAKRDLAAVQNAYKNDDALAPFSTK